MKKRAIILAGGKGTRLQPYTLTIPKPLVPIGEYPIVEIVIKQLINDGFNHITFAVNHQADLIKAFFKDGSKWGIKIDYSYENKALGTIAPLKLINDLPDNFLVMNADILTDFNYNNFYNYHIKENTLLTIASAKRKHKIEYGVLDKIENGKLKQFSEKPSVKYHVSTGIYMLNKKLLDFVPEGQFFGFDNLVNDLIKSKNNPSIYDFEGFWLDIGNPDDYELANKEYETNKDKFCNYFM